MTTFSTGRVMPASPDAVFDAFRDPARLARWWGPDGFTNTFGVFEFRPGGRWAFAMHGPNGATYPNESEFDSVVPGREVVVRHVSAPQFRLTVTLTEQGGGTLVGWDQAFEDDAVAEAVRRVCEPANEQNLDRLAAEVRAGS